MHEIGGFLEAPIDARKSHVSHLVDVAQAFHHPLADGHARHFALIFVGDFVHDFFHEVFDQLRADGAFLAGLADSGQEFFLGEFLAPTVPFHDHQAFMLDLLVGGKAMRTAEAFPASADDGPFARSPRINDLIIQATAFRTTHKRTTLPNAVVRVWYHTKYSGVKSVKQLNGRSLLTTHGEADRAISRRQTRVAGGAPADPGAGRCPGAHDPLRHQRRHRENEGPAGQNEPAAKSPDTSRPSAKSSGYSAQSGLARRA